MIIYFSKDIWRIIVGTGSALRGKGGEDTKLFLWIVLGTVPAGLAGILFKDWFESLFSKPKWVGGMLILTALVLYLTRYTKKEGRPLERMKWFDSVLIGIAQAVAIIPGISRSGITISTGLFCGLDRELSGRFSFLLSVPAILGATLLEFKKIDPGHQFWAVLLGTLLAFGVGILSLTFLMKMIKLGKIAGFSYYCCGFGVVMIILT